MPLVPALQVVHRLRTDQIVVTTMGTAREWPRLSQHPLDLHYIPSSMGQSPTLALGLAIAQPQRNVIVFTGDGSLLMNLGCLVTIVASGAKNLTLIVIDNGVYEVTGGQRTAGAVAGVDFAAWPEPPASRASSDSMISTHGNSKPQRCWSFPARAASCWQPNRCAAIIS